MRGVCAMGIALCALLTACTTVPELPQDTGPDGGIAYPSPDVENPGVIIIAEPQVSPPPPPVIPAPPPPPAEPPAEIIVKDLSAYEQMPRWAGSDPRAALSAFARSCKSWAQAPQDDYLNPNLIEYGRYRDWAEVCGSAMTLSGQGLSRSQTALFFENRFTPVHLSAERGETGLLTGYYEPEVTVRQSPTYEFREPILAKPANAQIQNRQRSQLNATSSRVIAYGRPIDVFFLQIQGSGRLLFQDGPNKGRALRAAYAGNNGFGYKSIGKVLVERGEMTLEQASKQAISDWMERAGYKAARELMNQNPRYIFFTEQKIAEGEGPRGAMRVPLTDMGSIAVDPRYLPYGTLVWLDTTLPQKGGDFRGKKTGLLVVAQDTGSAIRGPLRADLFFGSGIKAGDKAGVMKHAAEWSVLLPRPLAARVSPQS